LCSGGAELLHRRQIANNHVGTRTGSGPRLWQRWNNRRFGFAVDNCLDFDRLHRHTNRDFSHIRAGIRWSAEHPGEFIRDQEPSPLNREQLPVGIVIVFVAFNVEKRQTGPGMLYGEIEVCAG
jgi:hypothetical protein